jgi:group II intron reverse transcriptase/maturase
MAYNRIKSKPGNMTPGVDDETLDGFSYEIIERLVEEMKTESYQCKPVRRTYIPKANGKLRKLGIPSVRDKIVQEAVKMILEAIYDSPKNPYFSDCSHGFRRSRSCHTALEKIQSDWSGVVWFIEGDIQSCFDDIDHEILVNILREKIEDGRFLNLIRKILKAGYLDIDEIRKDSLAGSPQGGIVSPILSNIYLDKLDKFVEELREKLDKGKARKHNPEYKRLQDQRLYWMKRGETRSKRVRSLEARMKKLPSGDPNDPDFVRIKFIRYADDWLVGVIGSHKLAEDIKQQIGDFLKDHLKLTLSKEKTVITSAKKQEAKFLGFLLRVGRTIKEQKQVVTTNRTGKPFKKRSTGMEVIIKAPIKELVKRLQVKRFCDARGNPIHRPPWMLLDEDQLIRLYSSINRGIQEYYRPCDNWSRVQRIQYILKYSLAKTLAAKRKGKISEVIDGKEIKTEIVREEQKRIIWFYQNHDWTTRRNAFSTSRTADLVTMQIRLRTRSKLGLPCIVCGDTTDIEMHHVRHLKRMTDKQAKGFKKVMIAMNRKQIPVCKRCHKAIHNRQYDGLSLRDLAYDIRGATNSVRTRVKGEVKKLKIEEHLEDCEREALKLLK